MLCWAFGAHFVSHAPIASTSSAGLVVDEVSALRADIQDHAIFAKQISQDRFADTPANQLLTGLRGKDVLLAFVESYGQVAVQGSSFSPRVDSVLDKRDQAAPGRRLLRSERLPHLADVRRHQLAGALHPAVGPLGQQPPAL